MTECCKWGSVWSDDGLMHLVPCDESGHLLDPHIASESCHCHPEIDRKEGIVTHWVIQ